MTSLSVTTSGSGPRLVLLHGFTQDGALWGPLGNELVRQHEVTFLDLPGHGQSSHVLTDLEGCADAIAAQLGPEPFDLVGYSLGGRTALVTALRHPALVRRLVVIGATPGIELDADRRRRQHVDEEMANSLEASGDVASFVETWLAQPMFARIPEHLAGRDRRSTNTAAGLAGSLRLMGTGSMTPLHDALNLVTCPTLVIAGANDARFLVHAQTLVAGLRTATFSLIPGSGHACHLEQPELTTAVVTNWLGKTELQPNANPTESSAPTKS